MVSTKNPGGGKKADSGTLAALAATAELLRALGHTVIERDPKYPAVSIPFMVQVAGGVGDEVARAEHPELLEARTRRIARLTSPRFVWRVGERPPQEVGVVPRLALRRCRPVGHAQHSDGRAAGGPVGR